MAGAVPFLAFVLAMVLLLVSGPDVVAAQIIYPPLHTNDAVVLEPMLAGEPYGAVPDRPYSMNIVYDVPHHHQHHDDAYDGVVYKPTHGGDLPPNRHHHSVSTRVDEYGRPIPPAAPPDVIAHAAASHHESHPDHDNHPAPEMERAPYTHTEAEPEQPVYDDEPFLHQALDKSVASTDVTNALDHDLGELNVRESGDDLTVHVGKNKVKTETVATITATITATDEHEDSYINIHRNAHEASAGHEHDHLDGRAIYLDGAKHDALDQEGGPEILPAGPVETPAPDLSFLQDVEVLKVLFPWLEKHSGGQDPEPSAPKSLDHVLPA